jgi:glycosyltransferase involved in cell wall biosynthesis
VLDTTPTVTVLIATYNKAAALRHSIESVLWQTFQDFELLVIGDGCRLRLLGAGMGEG